MNNEPNNKVILSFLREDDEIFVSNGETLRNGILKTIAHHEISTNKTTFREVLPLDMVDNIHAELLQIKSSL